MLTLTRRVGDAVLIGDDVVITVTHIRGRRVSIAINAPARTSVGRLDAGAPRPLPRRPLHRAEPRRNGTVLVSLDRADRRGVGRIATT